MNLKIIERIEGLKVVSSLPLTKQEEILFTQKMLGIAKDIINQDPLLNERKKYQLGRALLHINKFYFFWRPLALNDLKFACLSDEEFTPLVPSRLFLDVQKTTKEEMLKEIVKLEAWMSQEAANQMRQ